jgi:DNA-binding HxlR family transcriptional regulator
MERIGEILGKRWNIEIVDVLGSGPVRFCDLRRSLTRGERSVTDRVLTERLRELEARGLVERGEGGYQLTEVGARLAPAFDMLRAVAEDIGDPDPVLADELLG